MIKILQQEVGGFPRLNDSNVISSWRFEDNVLDSIGSNDGITNNSTYNNLVIGKGKDLNVSNAYMKVNNNLNLGFTDGTSDIEGSFSFIMRLDYPSMPIPNTPYFLCKRGIGVSNQREYDLLITTSGLLRFRLFDKDSETNGGWIEVKHDLSTNYVQYNIYHVIVTYDGSGSESGLKMFINGDDVGISLQINTYTINYNYPQPFYSGTVSWSLNNSAHRPNSSIDELKKWNIALTPREVTELANKELNGIRIVG